MSARVVSFFASPAADIGVAEDDPLTDGIARAIQSD